MIAYIICGPIGSGKSYIANKLYSHLPIFDPDNYTDKLEDWSRKGSNAAWDLIHEKIKNYSSINLSFVVDSAQALRISRRRLTQYIRQVAPVYKIVCVFVKSPFEECRRRNKQRVRVVPDDTFKEYYDTVMNEPPSRDDGYDDVVVVDNSEYAGNNKELWTTKELWPTGWYHES